VTTATQQDRARRAERRARSKRAYWERRVSECGADSSRLAGVAWERARAAARQAERAGLLADADLELARSLGQWAEHLERLLNEHATRTTERDT
jgi:hypothetical protein